MSANTKINPEAQAEWEARQKDGGDAIRISKSIAGKANAYFALTASGFGVAALAVMVAASPMVFMIAPPAVMAAATALSRVGKNKLRAEFNQMAGAAGPGARLMLRPLDSAIPRHSALNVDDVNPQTKPVRVVGGVLMGFFLSLPLALMWISGLMLAEEVKSVREIGNKAKDVEAQYRLQGYKPT
jgi:hypothetical protein